MTPDPLGDTPIVLPFFQLATITMDRTDDRPCYDHPSRSMRQGRGPRAANFAKLILDTCRPFLAGPVEELRVLDVGCGYGHTTLELAKRCRRVLGIEPSRPLYSHAAALTQEAGPMKLAMRNVAVENLDDVEGFDLVVLDNVFEHLPDQRLALEKIRTCMAPRGVLFMVVPNKLWPIEVHYRLPLLSYLPLPLANVYLRCTRRGVDYRDASYAPTYFSLNRLLRSAGFEHRYVLPGDIRLATYGDRWTYRWGAAAIGRFPWLWIVSKAFLVIARRR